MFGHSKSMNPVAFVLIILALILSVCNCNGQIIPTSPPVGARILRVGVMVSLSGKYASIGSATVVTRQFWQTYVYNSGGIFGTNIYPVFTYCDVMSSPLSTISCIDSWKNSSSVDIIFAPENFLAGIVAAHVPTIPVIASISGIAFLYQCDVDTPKDLSIWLPACEKTYGRRFNNLYSSGNVARNLLSGWFGEAKNRGAKTIAMVQDGDSYNQEICQSGLSYSQDYEFKILYNYTLSGQYLTNANETTSVMNTLKKLNPDVVLFCNRPNCGPLVKLFKDNEYYPPALMTVQCIDSAGATSLGNSIDYMLGMSTWDSRLKSRAYQDNRVIPYGRRFASSTMPSALNFQQQYTNYTGGIQATGTQVGVYMGNVILEAAVIICNCTDSKGLQSVMSQINTNSFGGKLMFDTYGVVSYSDIIIYQWKEMSLRIVSPAKEATESWIYPAPSWDDRIFTKKPFETPIEKVFIALIVLFNCFNIFYFAGGLLMFRNHVQIKAISWIFSLLTATGCILSNFALLSWTVNNVQSQCNARPLLVVGFALQVCPINAKLFRLDAIFNSKTLQTAKMTNKVVLLIAMAHMLLLMIPLIVWVTMHPMIQYHIVYDPIRASLDYTDCGTVWSPFSYIVLAIGCIMLIEATTLAFLTRNVDVRFRETKVLVETFYYTMFPIGATILLQFYLGRADSDGKPSGTSRETLFFLRTSLMMLANETYLFVMFGPRIKEAWSQYTNFWGIFSESSRMVVRVDRHDKNITMIAEDNDLEKEITTTPMKKAIYAASAAATPVSAKVQSPQIPGQPLL